MKNILNKIISIQQNLTNKYKSLNVSINDSFITQQQYNSINDAISILNDKYFPEPLSEIEIRYDVGTLYIYYIKNNKRHIWLFCPYDISPSQATLEIINKINDDPSDYMIGTAGSSVQTYKINFENNKMVFNKNQILPNIKLKIIIDLPIESSSHIGIMQDKSYVYFNDNIIASMDQLANINKPPYVIYSLNNINQITLYFNIYGHLMAGRK